MIAAGRTMRQAIVDGTAFEIRHPVIFPYGYWPPAGETPVEVLACAQRMFGHRTIPAGTVFEVVRIIGGTIGGRIIESYGTITAE
jgi:hypothetical protein